MKIENLSQLKKALKTAKAIVILGHCRKDQIGQTHKIGRVRTQEFSHYDTNNQEVWCDFGKATNWMFTNHDGFTECTKVFGPEWRTAGQTIISFKVVE